MNIETIKEQLSHITDLASIFLLVPLSENAGFFANGGNLLYVAKDTFNYPCEGIETDYLKLQTHVRISAVKNNQTFRDDYYNLIVFKGKIDDSNLVSFVKLCEIHSNNSSDLNFKEFFYSLITLFQLPAEQSYLNIVGLYGELKFMEFALQHANVDISNSWHKNGSYSHYDFTNGEQNIEVKTILSGDYDVTIKHQQVFGEPSCTLAVVVCNQTDDGETIKELIASFYNNPSAFNSIGFSINLEKELKRVSANDADNLRFKVDEILFFNANDINPFPVLPSDISNLSYKMDVSDLTPMSDESAISLISQFNK